VNKEIRGPYKKKTGQVYRAKRKLRIFTDGYGSIHDEVALYFQDPISISGDNGAWEIFRKWAPERIAAFEKAVEKKLGYRPDALVNPKIWAVTIVQDIATGAVVDVGVPSNYIEEQTRTDDFNIEKTFAEWEAVIASYTERTERIWRDQDVVVWSAVKGFGLYITTQREPLNAIRSAQKTSRRKARRRMGRRNKARPQR